jgi:hypothetical protein
MGRMRRRRGRSILALTQNSLKSILLIKVKIIKYEGSTTIKKI